MSGVSSQAQPGGVVTPEAVLLEFQVAGAGSRAVGEALDIAVQVGLLGVVSLAVLLVGDYVGHTLAIVISLIMVPLVLVGYPAALESLWDGRTLGKAALGLRVVTVEGGPVRFRHAAIRSIIGLFEIYVTVGLVALLCIIFSPRDQRLGDHVAGTIVLRERADPRAAAVAVTFPAPYGLEGYVASIDASAVSGEQYRLVRSFLIRVFELSPQARWSLSVKLANAVAVSAHLAPPPGVGPELFLACVAAAYQRRHGTGVAPPVAAPAPGQPSGSWGPPPGPPGPPPGGPATWGPPAGMPPARPPWG